MSEDQEKNKGGRPRIDIPVEELEKLSRLSCTLDEIAAYFSCSRDTIERRMKDEPEVREAIERGRAHGKISLRRKQFQILEKTDNATMAIWLGKNILGQRDKFDIEVEVDAGDNLMTAFGLIDQITKGKAE